MKEYIERDAAAEDIAGIDIGKYLQEWGKSMWTCAVLQLHKDIVDYLVNLPAADVRPVVRGHWELHVFDGPPGLRPQALVCSNCLLIAPFKTPYCPHCGADMREDEG